MFNDCQSCVLNLSTEAGGEGDATSDAAFSLPSSSHMNSEQLQLLQAGHMTPFGTTSDPATPLPQDNCSRETDCDNTQSSTNDDLRSSDPKIDQNSTNVDVSVPSTRSGLRLCSEGFDGLFDTPTPSLPPPAARKVVRKKGVPSLRKGKGKRRVVSADCDGEGCRGDGEGAIGDGEGAIGEGAIGAIGEGAIGAGEGAIGEGAIGAGEGAIGNGEGAIGEGEGDWMPTRAEVEEMEREMAEYNRNGEEDGSTEYSTDEEMGAGIQCIHVSVDMHVCKYNVNTNLTFKTQFICSVSVSKVSHFYLMHSHMHAYNLQRDVLRVKCG